MLDAGVLDGDVIFEADFCDDLLITGLVRWIRTICCDGRNARDIGRSYSIHSSAILVPVHQKQKGESEKPKFAILLSSTDWLVERKPLI